MYYVYILKSKEYESIYTGITEDLERRIKEHNSGEVKFTKFKKPYKLVWYCAFLERKKAYRFERYLKTGSGIAFLRKRFI
jgi:predicted GIY-YIG superfamily endonuclease